MCVGIIQGFHSDTCEVREPQRDPLLQHWSEPQLQEPSSPEMSWQHLRGLVHLFVDLLDRQLDVKLDAVEYIFEIRLLIDFKLQKEKYREMHCTGYRFDMILQTRLKSIRLVYRAE